MLASIDIGSNTVRLLIGEVKGGRIKPHKYWRSITRLRGGMSETGRLDPEAREKTLTVLFDFSRICSEYKVRQVRAVATAAFRQASDGEDYAEQIRVEAALPLQIISGQEEAEITARGVLAALDPRPEVALILDVGGGSTEFVLQKQGRVLWSASRPFGVVRLIEEFPDAVRRQEFLSDEFSALTCSLKEATAEHVIPHDRLCLVGTAGTATTLAAMDLQMRQYDWRRINNYRLEATQIQDCYDRLSPLTVAERECLPGMEPGRGDLIMPGIEITMGCLAMAETQQFIVSDFGILEGCLLSLSNS